MKNQPNKIFLQVGLEEEGALVDFNNLSTDFITWESERIYSDDLEYLAVSSVLARIKELESRKFNLMAGANEITNFNMHSAVLNELKNLIK